MEIYWVHYFGDYLWEERIQALRGKLHIWPWEHQKSNQKRFLWEDIFTNGKLSSIYFITVTFPIEICYLKLLYLFIGCFFEYLPLTILHFWAVYFTSFKEFNILWTCYFYFTSIKSTNNFWIVQGMVDDFNKFLRNILLGVENTAD